MLWFHIFKGDAGSVPFVVNRYYGDFDGSDSRKLERACQTVIEYDRAWSGNTSTVLLCAVINSGQGDKWLRGANYHYSPFNYTAQGRRAIAQPLAWRWCLNVRLWGRGVRRANDRYHFAVGLDDLAYNPRGYPVLRAASDQNDQDFTRMGPLGSSYRQWLHYGTGSATPGAPLDYVPVSQATAEGITVMNKARRRQGRLFRVGVDWQKQTVNACVSASYAYSDLWAERGLEKPDYIGHFIKDRTLAIMGTAVRVAKTFKDNQRSNQGGEINDGEGWRVRFGATGATLKDAFSFLDQKYKDDQNQLAKQQPAVDVSGELYWHRAEAEEHYRVADDWYGYLGQFATFDFLCIDQQGLEDDARIDNYTPLYPDLTTHVDGLPKPQKNPHRRVSPGGLSLLGN